ncbi:two-component sensor histidine kinase [Eisenbergiella tayi]|nr:two-component sensor histidine kinase [Eisenbergiella tayi]
MRIIIGLSALLLIILTVKYIRMKKQIRYLTGQINDLADGASEKMLDMSLVDRDLEKLAGAINKHYAKQRYTVVRVVQHEQRLKESIANISHDLRTPLTVLMGHLQLVRKSDLTQEQNRRVETALHKAERMKELMETFYDLSLIDSEQAAPVKERINFSNLLLDFLTENAPLLESRNIIPDIRLPGCSVFLDTDRIMMERILQNLLSNAVRYCAGDIMISLSDEGNGKVVFCMENTVPAGTKIDTARIFDRFYTGDPSRHGESTGLGLAVVKVLTEKLGGEIGAGVRGDVLWIKAEYSIYK